MPVSIGYSPELSLASDYQITHEATVEVESMDEVDGSMGSGELLAWYWLLPDADADYDPDAADRAVNYGADDEMDEPDKRDERIAAALEAHGIQYPVPGPKPS